MHDTKMDSHEHHRLSSSVVGLETFSSSSTEKYLILNCTDNMNIKLINESTLAIMKGIENIRTDEIPRKIQAITSMSRNCRFSIEGVLICS